MICRSAGHVLYTSLTTIAAALSVQPATAQDKAAAPTAWEASRTVNDSDMVTTGVAKGRDRLNSATSTSVIKENEIIKLAPRSMGELFRNIPGVRAEAAAGDSGNSYTVRGLPLAGEGAKYLQIQEDGLPILEFGDFTGLTTNNFARVDLNIGQVESIRGGSSSTFASNAPGGVINLISKTGEVEGGSIMATTGVNYETYRIDADYGGHLSKNWRFHVGGFYRTGEGGRITGMNSFRGGQVKLNVTRQFDGGYIRLHGKYLDDTVPAYRQYPVSVTGTNDDPKFSDLPGFSINRDSLYSSNLGTAAVPASDGGLSQRRFRDGVRSVAKTAGIELQFELADWTITDRFRYADMAVNSLSLFPAVVGTPAQIGRALQIPGAAFRYANGPLQGQAFDTARGNGLLALSATTHINANNVNHLTNDLRASRVWSVGKGDLTTTGGLYKARQNLQRDFLYTAIIQDVRGDGGTSFVNVAAAGGAFPISQNGTLQYSSPAGANNSNRADVTYDILAPYGSFNFATGRIAVGGSLRYDFGRVNGRVLSAAPTPGCFDVNGNGVSVPGTAECRSAIFTGRPTTPIDYNYGYLSYSTGVNFRVSEPLALFARYSRGARAGAEALLFSPAISQADGSLVNKEAAFDTVRQAEGGLKYRRNGITLNLTGFYATTNESSSQINQGASGLAQIEFISRGYKAYGAELEGGIRRGPFNLTGSATIVEAEISKAENSALVGNKPRHQPSLIYQLTPQYDTDMFTIGANVVGVTGSYAQDVNLLKLPAYTTVGLFLQVRPVERLELSANVTNVFDVKAITETLDGTFPANNIALARTLYGRLASVSARVFF